MEGGVGCRLALIRLRQGYGGQAWLASQAVLSRFAVEVIGAAGFVVSCACGNVGGCLWWG
jgi:hypothetical protein